MKRGFRFQWLALCLAIAVCAAAPAAGGGGGTAGERARELRLQEAVMQVEAARVALDTAGRRVEEGVGLQQEVVERQLDLVRAERALAEVQAMESQRVSLDVKDTPLHVALTKLFEGTDESLILDPAISEAPRSVTLRFKDVTLESAVRAICKLHNLDYETDHKGLWAIMPSGAVATIGGERVRVIGAAAAVNPTITLEPGAGASASVVRRAGGESAPHVSYGLPSPVEFEGRISLARVGLSDLVDLEVENARLGEVAVQLGVKRGDEWQVEILVHEAVPEDIRVTAKVYRMRRDDLLLLLAEQARLDISIDSPMPGEATPERPHTRVYFVPRPELRVSGTGVGDEMTVLGRVFEYGSAEAARRGAEDARKMAEELGRQTVISTGRGTKVNSLGPCPQCGASVLLPDWKYCPFCGAQITPEDKQPEEKE